MNQFLPICKADMRERGWEQVDFVLVSGDAYVDHPSFGTALIGRLLESYGYRVAILSQPDWHSAEAFREFGEPTLAFLVTAGNMDSMVNHYTANRKPRSDDAYTPSGVSGKRPDRASIIYSMRCKEAYHNVPVILGGIEASLRRFVHYDYWQNKLRRSILFDSKADAIVYGMAEKTLIDLADGLSRGRTVASMSYLNGLCSIVSYSEIHKHSEEYLQKRTIVLPSWEVIQKDKRSFLEAHLIQEREQNPFTGKTLLQQHGDRYLMQTPPALPLSQKMMDAVYALPFLRTWHPSFEKMGGVPALKEVEFSITSHRGCYGGCSFCALTFHQGRIIQKRSKDSIIDEAVIMSNAENFKGYIHDVGGPTANFRNPACHHQLKRGACKHRHCMTPEPCKELDSDHSEYLDILRTLRELPNIKKVFVRSGIRYDYLLLDSKTPFLKELCEHHISGQLKVAPEHVSPNVLLQMQKSPRVVYDDFKFKYEEENRRLGKKQFLVPYFMSGHPASTLKDAVMLAEAIRDWGVIPEQVQDFIPTPGSLSTAVYYSELDPKTFMPIHVAKDKNERAMQRALLQYGKPENYLPVKRALIKAGRTDLIGYHPHCLIRPSKVDETHPHIRSKKSSHIKRAPKVKRKHR